VVAATEQELALKQGSAVSKAIRTQGLRLIPGDILDECKAIIQKTRAAGAAAEDPETARKAILDNFAELGVMPADLARYLEHDTNVFQPAERELLRGVYSAIKNGMGTWRDIMDAKFGAAEGAEESIGTKKIREALEKRKAPVAAAPAPPAPPAPAQESATPPMIPTFATWDDAGDPISDEHGLSIIVSGVEYVRAETNQTWTAKGNAPAAPSAHQKRGAKAGRSADAFDFASGGQK